MLIDPKSQIPIFRQIADQLLQAIIAGVYKPGESLPSLRQLAVDIQVNPNTIQRAYEALEREGVVESRRGVGIFVSATSRIKLSSAEKRIAKSFKAAIRQGARDGLKPDKMRQVFELSLHRFLTQASL